MPFPNLLPPEATERIADAFLVTFFFVDLLCTLFEDFVRLETAVYDFLIG